MSIPQNVAAIIDGKITFHLEGIDRMYLNGYNIESLSAYEPQTLVHKMLYLNRYFETVPG